MQIQYQQQEEEEMEIDLRDMLIDVVRHWRKCLILGLVFAVLLGGYRYLNAYRSYQDQLLDAKEQKEASFDLWEYEQKKAKLEEVITRTEEKMDQISEYRTNSLLMNLEPYDYYWATRTYYVTTNYQIIPELGLQDKDYTDSVLAGYDRMVVDNALYDDIRALLGLEMDDRYVSELFRFSVDYGTDMITMQAVGETEAIATRILDVIRDKMLGNTDTITEEIHEHEIKMITEKTEHINYDDANSSSSIKVKSRQESYTDQYLALNDTLLETQEELNDLEEDSPIVSMNVKGILKYVLLGFVGGVGVTMIFYMASYVLGGSVKTEDEIRRVYGLPILGRHYAPARSKAYLDRRIMHLERGEAGNESLEDTLKLTAAKINALLPENGELLLVGTLSEEELKNVYEQLKGVVKGGLSYGGNLLSNPEAMERVTGAEHIVIVERLRASRRSRIENEMEILSTLKRDVLGVVLA